MARRALAALLLLAACDESPQEPPEGPPAQAPSPLDLHCAAFAEAACAALERCWPNRAGKPTAVCREEVRLGCVAPGALRVRRVADADRVEAAFRAVLAGRLAFDEDAATACVARLRVGCSEVWPPSACTLEKFLHPRVPLQGACRAHHECAGGYCRYAAITDCEGRCTAYQPADEPCENHAECGPDAFCQSPDKLCARYKTEADTDCAGGCRPDLVCDGGRCKPPVPIGGDCSSDTPPCVLGATCRRGVCGALGEAGDTCTLFEERLSCAPSLFCDHGPTLSSNPGTCAPRLDNGKKCFFAFDCKPGQVCLGAVLTGTPAQGRCGPPPPPGNACTPPPVSTLPSECGATHLCAGTSPTCKAWLMLGDACDPSEERCPVGARCQGSPPTCQPDRGQRVGELCGFLGGRQLDCAPDGDCVPRPAPLEGGTCMARKAEGASCRVSSECLSDRCIGRACAPACP